MDYGNCSLDTSTNLYKWAHISKTLSFASPILYQYLMIRITVIIAIPNRSLFPHTKLTIAIALCGCKMHAFAMTHTPRKTNESASSRSEPSTRIDASLIAFMTREPTTVTWPTDDAILFRLRETRPAPKKKPPPTKAPAEPGKCERKIDGKMIGGFLLVGISIRLI